MERRTQAERDADTVEIAYALFVAASLAGCTMLAVASPAFFFGVTSPSEGTLVRAGVIAGAVAFFAVLATILLRHGRAPHRRDEPDRPNRADRPDRPDQPSQPGRTSPDS
ncbi:DUF6332 family protein [Streptomyces sp. Je 1-369]|uniref:DUF6332 family protein n=1 Tax=Streptomyces sp. Je 1-369 TaxID=2966192 RepID=UPI0022861C36|nr:DUF6332 family protein [Streptomyces sp. Je 1-369]WAL93913.1 DUF6332 family protein [Streptomyces sp. Je 1-369]